MALYTYRCRECGYERIVSIPIDEYDTTPAPTCPSCAFHMQRDYGADAPRPAPMWPEHFNPTTGTVIRDRKQMQSDLDRAADALYERTGIEQRPVVIDRADMADMRAE